VFVENEAIRFNDNRQQHKSYNNSIDESYTTRKKTFNIKILTSVDIYLR